jgi:superfamily II RNA helicase
MSAQLNSKNLPENPTADDILNVFLDYLAASGTEPYDHQEEAILELFAGNNVILNTPTGSGKSLVALAMQFKSLCQGRRSYYTVPIKALANEKFLSLCHVLGAENVGMITGDATVNHDAPVICCTAEILANIALREGASAKVDDVIMDEFHYYSDHSRGAAWQIPLLTFPQARFLLMSATLGDSSSFSKGLTDLTGVPTTLVQSDQRPVPLEFEYSTTQLQEKVAELNEQGRSPIYLVHFTQNACADTARDLLSTNFCTKEEKTAIARALDDADFCSPYGRELAKIIRHGIGIHHAGLLPKYRLLVEKLTAKGLLKVVCGTDTLGVGVNVPIRTVMLTGLCKYDGRSTKILAVRDFRQIVGRAGRRGFDTVGYVVAQAPEHIIENLRLEAKAAANKKKSFQKRKPPEKGFVHWDEQTFTKLQTAPPEPLVSSFSVYHHTLLNVLSRNSEDGCVALKKIIDDSHESPSKKKALKQHAFKLFRGLVGAKILHIIPPSKRTGPQKVIIDLSLPEDFSINHALSLYLLDAIPKLDKNADDYALNLISLVESILENPDIVLRKQVDLLKSELMARLKDEGMEFDDRIALLEEVEWPKPGVEFIYQTYNDFKLTHPYLGSENVKPKSIAREMIENYQSFEDYIKTYKLERAEAVLLRHLGEVYKVLAQTVPDSAKTEHVYEAESFLELIVRHTDSSLLDEWQAMKEGITELLNAPSSARSQEKIAAFKAKIPYTEDKKAFGRHLRNHVLTLVTALSRYDTEAVLSLIELHDSDGKLWSNERLLVLLNTYHDARHQIRLDPEARNARHTHLSDDGLTLHQTLIDPDDFNDWSLQLSLDRKKSDTRRTPVLHLESLGPI